MGDICGVCVCVGKFGSAPAAGGTGAGSLKASDAKLRIKSEKVDA